MSKKDFIIVEQNLLKELKTLTMPNQQMLQQMYINQTIKKMNNQNMRNAYHVSRKFKEIERNNYKAKKNGLAS